MQIENFKLNKEMAMLINILKDQLFKKIWYLEIISYSISIKYVAEVDVFKSF